MWFGGVKEVGMARPTTVGVLYPGHAAEDDFPRLERLLGGCRLPVVHTPIDSDVHAVDPLLDMGAPWRLAEGVRALRPAGVDAVVWACTSGSFVRGWAGAQAQAKELGALAGVPASSTSLAFVAAARALGARQVAVVATYPEDVAEHFVTFLGDAGLRVARHESRGIMTATEVGALDRAAVLELVAEHADGVDAVLLPDTAMHTVEYLEELEERAAAPVLTANQVTVWEGLRLAGDTAPRARGGRLFA